MNFVKFPIHTIALGVVASMAADIFANGDHRIAGEHSTVMIHPHMSIRMGSHSNLLANAKSDEIEHNRRLVHYLNNSKYSTIKEVEENLFGVRGDDHWLTPEESLEHGICDEIAKSNKRKRSKQYGSNLSRDLKLTKVTHKRTRKKK